MVTSHVKRTNVTTKSKSEYDVGNTYIYIVCVYNMYVILNSIKYIPYLDIYIYIIFTNIYIYIHVCGNLHEFIKLEVFAIYGEFSR